MPHYSNTVKNDGSYDRSVIMQLAVIKARAERNAMACLAAGIRLPRMPLGNVAAFYATEAAKIAFPDTAPWTHYLAKALADVWDGARVKRAALRTAPVAEIIVAPFVTYAEAA